MLYSIPQLAIAFPNINPVIFEIGPLAIRWYSLSYIFGIIFGWLYARKIITHKKLWGGHVPITQTDIDDFIVWATIGTVLGGRIGYVMFYGLDSFLENPASIIRVWEGGMSFHGGFLGVTLAMFLFARTRKIPVWRLFDIVAVVVPIGIGFGRIANFINGELWGRASDAPWAIIFPTGGPLARHPSQLYEAFLEGAVLLVILTIAVYRFNALHKPRLTTGLFVAGYGIARTIVEFFREPDAHIGYLADGWLTMGMILSIPMIIIGSALVISARDIKVSNRKNTNDAT